MYDCISAQETGSLLKGSIGFLTGGAEGDVYNFGGGRNNTTHNRCIEDDGGGREKQTTLGSVLRDQA